LESIVRRQGARFDLELIRLWGSGFAELKQSPDLLRPFEEAVSPWAGAATGGPAHSVPPGCDR